MSSIRIRNIYHMLSYAYKSLRQTSYQNLANEPFEHVADLFAAILAMGMADQVRRGITKDYREHTESLPMIRGKIEWGTTLNSRSVLTKKLVCRYDVYDENIYLNQILYTTAHVLLRNQEVCEERKRKLKKTMMFFAGCDLLDHSSIQWNRIQYHRNNVVYKMLINVCYLVLHGLLLRQESGAYRLANFIDDQKRYQLFQRFVLCYYQHHYPHYHPRAQVIKWQLDDSFIDFLPNMVSDVLMEYGGRTVILDTKYYRKIMSKRYYSNPGAENDEDKVKVNSANLYQMFSYVKNYAAHSVNQVSGLLLYANTNEQITPDVEYRMGGNVIRIKTVDLDQEFSLIETQLHDILKELI